MTAYPSGTIVREARARYFLDNGFGEGGYDDPWVKFKLWRIPVRIRNTAGRVRAVRLHDLHHIATGYATSLVGEAEIGAWEIGSGCAHHRAAWALNLSAFGLGALVWPRRTFAAFVRGRRSTSLYRRVGEFDERLLDLSVEQLRTMLALDEQSLRVRAADRIAFVGWIFASLGLLGTGPFGALAFWLAMSFEPMRRPIEWRAPT